MRVFTVLYHFNWFILGCDLWPDGQKFDNILQNPKWNPQFHLFVKRNFDNGQDGQSTKNNNGDLSSMPEMEKHRAFIPWALESYYEFQKGSDFTSHRTTEVIRSGPHWCRERWSTSDLRKGWWKENFGNFNCKHPKDLYFPCEDARRTVRLGVPSQHVDPIPSTPWEDQCMQKGGKCATRALNRCMNHT